MIKIYLGNVGCLSGDTVININRNCVGKRKTIAELFESYDRVKRGYDKSIDPKIPTKVRSFDGERIRLHEIEDVVYSGRKEVYTFSLIDGKTLECTKEHKIMTTRGFIPCISLCKDDKVMVDTLKPRKGSQKSYKFRDIKINSGHHPFPQNHNRIPVHILTYEAYMNNMSFIDYMDILWNDKDSIKNLKFVDRSSIAIHHIDGNHYNNSIDNLKAIKRVDHFKKHSFEGESFRNFNQGIPRFVKIKRLPEYSGIKKTYDIICKEPYHNFTANGMIVHNSGKTLSAVREMFINETDRIYYSNIRIKNKDVNALMLKPSMIIKKEQIDTKRKKDGTLEPVYELSLNKEYWQSIKSPISVILDEAHSIINSRRSMSKINVIVTDWLALIRRVLGSDARGEGEFTMITQLPNRIDIIAREMAHQVRYHVCYWLKVCMRCKARWHENSDQPEVLYRCPRCKSWKLGKKDHRILVYKFQSMEHFNIWKDMGEKTYYDRYFMENAERFFPMYDTLQWDNMFSEFY